MIKIITSKMPIISLLLFSGFVAQAQLGWWQAMSSGTSEDLHDVHFWSSDTGVVVGDAATVLMTVNGNSWSSMSVTGTSGNLYGVDLNGQTGFAVGNLGNYAGIKTTDGGANWDTVAGPESAVLNAIEMVNDTLWYAVGNGGKLFKTINAGDNWTSENSGTSENLYDIFFLDQNRGWIVGANNTVRTSTNGGSSWGSIFSLSDTYDFYGVHFLSASIGSVVGKKGATSYIVGTVSGGIIGTDWYATPILPGALEDIDFIDSTGLTVGGASGGPDPQLIVGTLDNSTWIQQDSVSPNSLKAVDLVSDSVAYAVGINGTIIKTNKGIHAMTAIQSAESVHLLNLYPNPAQNELVAMQINDDYRGPLQLKIYDTAGKLLQERSMQKGQQQFQEPISLSGLGSGTFLIELTGENVRYAGTLLKAK